MTPVISPLVFYVLPIAETMSFISLVVSLSSIIGLGIIVWTIYDEKSYMPNEEKVKFLEKLKKQVTALAIVFTILAIFIPRESTLTKMIIAQNVTYERVEQATNTVENVYNDIMDLFRESE